MNVQGIFEYETTKDDAVKDPLFSERFEAFMDKCLADIKIFSEREMRPYEETRRSIAEWHAKYLFQTESSFPVTTEASQERSNQVRTILRDTSRILESLAATSGVQAFVLAVDPHDASDAGFLGGSLLGREFWRGMRAGGESGAKAFKQHCTSHLHAAAQAERQRQAAEQEVLPPSLKTGLSKSVKSELYEAVRTALRQCSGVRSAEMKWSNPEKLDVYGVRLVGWPDGIPAQNPSMLKVGQNRVLLEALQNGFMRFERIDSPRPRENLNLNHLDANASAVKDPVEDDFSWAYDADAEPVGPPQNYPAKPIINNSLPSLPSSSTYSFEKRSEAADSVLDTDPMSPFNMEYTSPDDFNGLPDTLDPAWTNDYVSALERPRKRLRSVEPESPSLGSGEEIDSH
ncbi:hypothetical protein CPC08DRAFT_704810 [Agrocybe pediades]|nr:hypothetical protein CPC08DRAFT_704810 [Agrocybe pediades]